jgi:hypothetical protein
MKTYTLKVEADPANEENYLISFPDEFIKESGWNVGDEIQVNVEDGKLHLKKIEEVLAGTAPLPPSPPPPRIIHEGVKIINPAKTSD